MAIKYEVKTGAKDLNEIARAHKKDLEKRLKGMRCGKCNQDTLIRFVEFEGRVAPEINSCCEEFRERIHKERWPNG